MSKKEVEKKLVERYGQNYKTPLAKALGVDVSTVRRMFNNDKELSSVNERAILCVLNHQ
jgi:energy-converting hydrogenase A subunit M